jgi:hypothetical protein
MIKRLSMDTEAQTSYPLYNGEVRLTFKNNGHRYEIDGKDIVGVTTILRTVIAKEAITGWAVKTTADYILNNYNWENICYTKEELIKLVEDAKKEHRVKKESAADIGTRAHKWIETYIKAKIGSLDIPPLPEEPDLIDAVKGFLSWEQSNKVTFEASEKPVYSRKFDYCGTLDFIAVVNGKRILGDIKTSNAIYPESYYLQVAAYRYAYEEEHPESKIDGMLIIRIPKDTKSTFEIRSVNDYQDNATAFIYAVHLYKQVSKLKNFAK